MTVIKNELVRDQLLNTINKIYTPITFLTNKKSSVEILIIDIQAAFFIICCLPGVYPTPENTLASFRSDINIEM